jgi:hypothetical protein
MSKHTIYHISPELDKYLDTGGALNKLIPEWFSQTNYKKENEDKFMKILENESNFECIQPKSAHFLFTLLKQSTSKRDLVPFIERILSNPVLTNLFAHFYFNSDNTNYSPLKLMAKLRPRVESLSSLPISGLRTLIHHFPRELKYIDAAIFYFKDSLPPTMRTRAGFLRSLCGVYTEAVDAWNQIPMLNAHLFTTTQDRSQLPPILFKTPDEILKAELPKLIEHYTEYALAFDTFYHKYQEFVSVLDLIQSNKTWPTAQIESYYSWERHDYEFIEKHIYDAQTTEKQQRKTLSTTYESNFEQAQLIARSHARNIGPELNNDNNPLSTQIENIIQDHKSKLQSSTEKFKDDQTEVMNKMMDLAKELKTNYTNYHKAVDKIFTSIKSEVVQIAPTIHSHQFLLPPQRPEIPHILNLYKGDVVQPPQRDQLGLGNFIALGDSFGPTNPRTVLTSFHFDTVLSTDWNHSPSGKLQKVFDFKRDLETGLCCLHPRFESILQEIARKEETDGKTQPDQKNTKKNQKRRRSNNRNSDDDDNDPNNNNDDEDDHIKIEITPYDTIHPYYFLQLFDRIAMQITVSMIIRDRNLRIFEEKKQAHEAAKAAAKKLQELNPQSTNPTPKPTPRPQPLTPTFEDDDEDDDESDDDSSVDEEDNDDDDFGLTARFKVEEFPYIDQTVGIIRTILINASTEPEKIFNARFLMLLRSHCVLPLLLQQASSVYDSDFTSLLESIIELSPQTAEEIVSTDLFTQPIQDMSHSTYRSIYDEQHSSTSSDFIAASINPCPFLQQMVQISWDRIQQHDLIEPPKDPEQLKRERERNSKWNQYLHHSYKTFYGHSDGLPLLNLDRYNIKVSPLYRHFESSPQYNDSAGSKLIVTSPLYHYGTYLSQIPFQLNPLLSPVPLKQSPAVTLHLLMTIFNY